MLKNTMDTSLTVLWSKYSYKKYQYIIKISTDICKDSHTHILTQRFLKGLRMCFKYSLLGRIIQTEIRGNQVILDNSKFIQYIVNSLYRRYKTRFNDYLNVSRLKRFTLRTKEEIYYSPVKVISIIVIIAVTISILLSFIFKKDIILWDWLLRSLLLLVGVISLFFNLDWQVLKKNSIIFKLIARK